MSDIATPLDKLRPFLACVLRWSDERRWSDGGQEIDDITRRRGHVSFLMESASLAILTAIHAGIELDLHRREA